MIRQTRYILWAIGCLFALGAQAQEANFRQAERLLGSRVENILKSTRVTPNTIQESSSFWYKYETGDGIRYYYVNPRRGIRQEMFDRVAIAGEITKLTHEPVDHQQLDLKSVRFEEDERHFTFKVDTFVVRCALDSKAVEVKGQKQAAAEQKAADLKKKKKDKPKPTKTFAKRARTVGNYSPDGKFCVYVKDHNLYLFRERDKYSVQLTTDGEERRTFALRNTGKDGKEAAADVYWWGDSQAFMVTRTDSRGVETIPYMYYHGKRPSVRIADFVMPGDPHVPHTEMYVCDTATMTLRRVPIERWQDQQVKIYTVQDKSRLFFLREKRTSDEVDFCRLEKNGEVKVLINETCKPYFNDQLFDVRLERNGEEIYWWSERTGYGHYYRYDGEGRLMNAVTAGPWTAGGIVRLDTLKGEMLFYAYGQVEGECPYYQRLNRVRTDGKGGVEMLTPEMATHKVTVLKDGYFVDNYSRADLAPRSVLRAPNGRLIMELETADLTPLFELGWQFPEPIQVKAADGCTDLYGFLWKPADFDSTRRYPIISYVYPGPQTEAVPLEFMAGGVQNPLAQAGFVVVTFGHRGGSPLRGKWYHTYGHGNLRDYPLADDKYGIEQLIKRYPYIDGRKVGIFGHSGGGFMAMAALCTYPDFYTAAVSSAGNHDNRIYNQWWGETHQGLKEVKAGAKPKSSGRKAPAADTAARDSVTFTFEVETNLELVDRLRGHLMLVFGDADDNVHPANTLRLADALLKAGKNFEMVVLPQQNHQYRGEGMDFFQRKVWFFFAKHLLGDYTSEGFTDIDEYMHLK